jgi:mannose-6-phosphate isomerase-like protein (cupin superfamily)
MANTTLAHLHPKAIHLDPGDQSYFKLLGGPPETRSIKSGLVTLSPGKSIGLHSTKSNEEVIVPLAGSGQLHCVDHDPIDLSTGLIAYVPPQTEHDVINTGSIDLRYIFIVAKAE